MKDRGEEAAGVKAEATRGEPDGPRARGFSPAALLVCGLTALWIAFFAWSAVMRHAMFRSSALDLGYMTQAAWNTLHGHVMEFSTYRDIAIDLPLDQFRRTDHLLAYHVELLLIPLSLLLLIRNDPAVLLVFQALAVGLGALPAFGLTRRRLGSDFAGLAFACVYLLAPALNGAVLSDFHPVALTASLLLCAFYLLETGRRGAFLLAIVLALAAKEEISALVFLLGLYLIFWRRERRLGAVAAGLGLAWFVVATRLIMPHFSGLAASPFLARLAIFGPGLRETFTAALAQPVLVVRWLWQPEVRAYLGGLLATAGFASLFSPQVLLLTAPVLALNVFSQWNWTYSEGAHYSASLIPFIVASAIYGVAFLARRIERAGLMQRRSAVIVLSGLALAISLAHHWQLGMTPLGRSFRLPQITAHHRLADEFIALIPADAALSAQANLYPHVALRGKAYLFPAVADADYVFLDVTSPTYPTDVAGLQAAVFGLLDAGGFGVLRAQDGYLLLKRGLPPGWEQLEGDAFLTFARGPLPAAARRVSVRFGDALELVGYDYDVHNVVTAGQPPATIATYWRPLRKLSGGYQFVFYFTREDGAVVGQYADGVALTAWYPSWAWRPAETLRVETPVLPVGRRRWVLVAVAAPWGDPTAPATRVGPIRDLTDEPLEILQEGTLVKLFVFP